MSATGPGLPGERLVRRRAIYQRCSPPVTMRIRSMRRIAGRDGILRVPSLEGRAAAARKPMVSRRCRLAAAGRRTDRAEQRCRAAGLPFWSISRNCDGGTISALAEILARQIAWSRSAPGLPSRNPAQRPDAPRRGSCRGSGDPRAAGTVARLRGRDRPGDRRIGRRTGARASRGPAQGWKRKSDGCVISSALVMPSTLIVSRRSR